MKTIGLIGGLSWESSLEYYKIINKAIKQKLGGLHSARCIMYSFDFAPVEELMRRNEWGEITRLMVNAGHGLKKAGSDFIVICSNTMHKAANDIQEQVDVPVLHIADATAEKIKLENIGKVGLLGTRFAMEGKFYRNRLENKHNRSYHS